MKDNLQKNHSRQIRMDIDTANSIGNVKNFASKRIKKYSNSDIAKSRSESRISQSSYLHPPQTRKPHRFLYGKKDHISGKVGDLNHSSPRDSEVGSMVSRSSHKAVTYFVTYIPVLSIPRKRKNL